MSGVEGTIIAAMGIHNIKNYEGRAQEIILSADNDGPESHTKNVIQQTASLLKNQNKTVTIITPKSTSQDFNDVLKDEGVHAVQQYVAPYLHPQAMRLDEPEIVQKFERSSQIDPRFEHRQKEFQDALLLKEKSQDLLHLTLSLPQTPSRVKPLTGSMRPRLSTNT